MTMNTLSAIRKSKPWDLSMDPHAVAKPRARALYRPTHEKDACGVGFIANMKGENSHRIVATVCRSGKPHPPRRRRCRSADG